MWVECKHWKELRDLITEFQEERTASAEACMIQDTIRKYIHVAAQKYIHVAGAQSKGKKKKR